jgi:putative membrane protein
MSWQALFETHGLGLFAIYFATAVALWLVFNRVYLYITPYDEATEIKAGKVAPAIALVGAEIGFLLPLCTASYVTRSFYGFVAWGVVAAIVQIVGYKAMYLWGRGDFESDNVAMATTFAGVSLGLGLINAFAMIP